MLLDPQKLEPRVGDTLTRISRQFQGESGIRLSLGRRLINVLPVAERVNALTNGVDGRTTRVVKIRMHLPRPHLLRHPPHPGGTPRM